MAGYAGTQHRATYTCVGDSVNLAARIESHTKVAGYPIIIDTPTRAGLPDSIQVKSLGPVVFKGITIPMEVFAVDPDQIVK
jgi:class 3 adenylate cyclase